MSCIGRPSRRLKNVYLTIFGNQIMCLKTDGGWYCSCGILKPNENFGVCLFIKNFEKLHEDAVQHLCIILKKILLLQDGTLEKQPEVQKVLRKEW